MNKLLLVLLLIISLTGAAFAAARAASLNATGYDWLGYSKEDKFTFAQLLYVVHGVDKNKNKPDDIIKALDDFYYGAIKEAKADPLGCDEDASLKIRCVSVIANRLTRPK